MFLSVAAFLIVVFLILGLVIGSFGNVLISRIPTGESILGRSHCPSCKKTIHKQDLIPILSYVVLRGRCRSCKKRISYQYPLVEGATAGLFLIGLMHADFAPLRGLILGLSLSLLLWLALIDLKTKTVPDALTVPFLILCALFATLSSASLVAFPIIAPLLGGGFFAIQWIMSRGKWIGSGDILIGFGAGLLLLTWQLVVIALLLSYVIGAIVASILLLSSKKKMDSALPFVPFLAIGTILAVQLGAQILRFILPYY